MIQTKRSTHLMWNPSAQTSSSQAYAWPCRATACVKDPTAPLVYFLEDQPRVWLMLSLRQNSPNRRGQSRDPLVLGDLRFVNGDLRQLARRFVELDRLGST